MILAASAGNAVGMAVGGVLAVLVISAVFYLVGRGEDRDRAAAPADATPAVPGEAGPAAGDRGATEPALAQPPGGGAAAEPAPVPAPGGGAAAEPTLAQPPGGGAAAEPAPVTPRRPRAPASARRRRRP
jgi:hypothetical protein